MNYIERIARRLDELVPDCPAELLRFYALLVLTTGRDTSQEHVHDAWSAWRTADVPGHPSLIPFHALEPEVRILDEPYATAIRKVAAELEAMAEWSTLQGIEPVAGDVC